MSFTDTQLAALAAPLLREHVRGRKQGGREVSYIEGWHVIAEANRIFGFDAWDRETVECRMVVEREGKVGSSPNQRDGWRVGYTAKVRVSVLVFDEMPRTIRREGTGFGSGIDVDLGAAHESAIKEAETDAMKRALMTFGNPFGLALYDKTQAEVDPPGRSASPPPSRQNGAAHTPPPPQKHPRWNEANEAYTRIERAMNAAATPKMVDELIRANDIFLTLIKDVSQPDYENLMAASVARKQELMLSA